MSTTTAEMLVIRNHMGEPAVRLVQGDYSGYYNFGTKAWQHSDAFWQIMDDCFPDSQSRSLANAHIHTLEAETRLMVRTAREALEAEDTDFALNHLRELEQIFSEAEIAAAHPPLIVGSDLDEAMRNLTEEEYHDIADEVQGI